MMESKYNPFYHKVSLAQLAQAKYDSRKKNKVNEAIVPQDALSEPPEQKSIDVIASPETDFRIDIRDSEYIFRNVPHEKGIADYYLSTKRVNNGIYDKPPTFIHAKANLELPSIKSLYTLWSTLYNNKDSSDAGLCKKISFIKRILASDIGSVLVADTRVFYSKMQNDIIVHGLSKAETSYYQNQFVGVGGRAGRGHKSIDRMVANLLGLDSLGNAPDVIEWLTGLEIQLKRLTQIPIKYVENVVVMYPFKGPNKDVLVIDADEKGVDATARELIIKRK